ncbi:unnamed protein product [marine sediment metagenome]|uniref:Uncharacterized protein n=1 Tax=marine sediment metagenome TaxID=412755 RepID=X1NQG9_9ZZZZ
MIPPKQNGNFVAHMEKVLEVYKRPYDTNSPVVCMDESPKQLIKEGEISYVKDLMKATVPEVNEIIYKAMPDVVRNGRTLKYK